MKLGEHNDRHIPTYFEDYVRVLVSDRGIIGLQLSEKCSVDIVLPFNSILFGGAVPTEI